AGDAAPANDADSLRIRVGPGPLEVTEIQFHPASGEGEWVEVRNRAGEPLSLADFSLADRRGAPGLPAGGIDPLAAESLAVLVQDRLALLARFPALDPARVWEVKPWGSLNNSDDSAGVADVVTLRESDGTACDRVAYSATGVPAGVPLERRADGAWAPATDPLGSPLAPPRALPPLAGRFAVSPRRLRALGTRTASIGWDLPWPRGRIAVDLYDLAGRRVTQVLPETAVAARGERVWSAAELPPGLYLLALVARAEGGAETLTLTQPLRIEGSAP
ncbi:MAG: lamin tail domain-containing protein, partial [Candidatus Eisenbacteria bacterium]